MANKRITNNFKDIPNPNIKNCLNIPKDETGKQLEYGDLLAQWKGAGPEYKMYSLWLYLGQTDSRGYIFTGSIEELDYFYHCDAAKSLILNLELLTEKTIDAFISGGDHFTIDHDDERDIHTIINNSELY